MRAEISALINVVKVVKVVKVILVKINFEHAVILQQYI